MFCVMYDAMMTDDDDSTAHCQHTAGVISDVHKACVTTATTQQVTAAQNQDVIENKAGEVYSQQQQQHAPLLLLAFKTNTTYVPMQRDGLGQSQQQQQQL